ncbi:hypothetical protein O3276_02035 [Endozoicomonas sp. GU-1]|nr:hypothetical protein [Endozoicomonas sp. GU-1]WBA86847.1 hypothetical protein O3276_02035 [Endozoicomonas sp. GU-1]
MKYLLVKGADVNAYSSGRTTPVVEAAAQGNLGLVKHLVHKSATIEADHSKLGVRSFFLKSWGS